MTTATVSDQVKTLAKDLTKDFPSSPRRVVGGFVLAGRMLDKCRAVLAGTAGEYHFNCPLDKMVLDFSGIDPEAFKAFVASGATDEQVDEWVRTNAKVQDPEAIVQWNNKMRDMRLSDLPVKLQMYMETYIPEFVPEGKIVRVFFDVYDYEEGRL
jgi:Domain of unknown function (DUF5069)